MNSFDKLRHSIMIRPVFVAFSSVAFVHMAGCAPGPDVYGLFGGNNGNAAGVSSGSGGVTDTGGSSEILDDGGSGGTVSNGGTGGNAGAGGAGGNAGAGGTGGNAGTGGAPGNETKPLYVVSIDHAASPSVLLKIDVATGIGKVACTLPSSVDEINYHSSTFSRTGLLFASNYQDARIDKIDPCTCEVTPVGPTGFGSIPGITVNQGPGLYGIETTVDILLDINTMTGKGNKLGDLGIDFTTAGATWSNALLNGQGGLYAMNGATNSLYTINPVTGAATAITPISGVTFGSVGIEMHPMNEIIYTCTNDAILYAIDPVTGAATGIGNGMGHVSECNNLAAPWIPVPCLDAL